MDRWKESGDCAKGSYFPTQNLVIVRDLTERTIIDAPHMRIVRNNGIQIGVLVNWIVQPVTLKLPCF
jgi:hypothetical protein